VERGRVTNSQLLDEFGQTRSGAPHARLSNIADPARLPRAASEQHGKIRVGTLMLPEDY
jgi:hypothetical protein